MIAPVVQYSLAYAYRAHADDDSHPSAAWHWVSSFNCAAGARGIWQVSKTLANICICLFLFHLPTSPHDCSKEALIFSSIIIIVIIAIVVGRSTHLKEKKTKQTNESSRRLMCRWSRKSISPGEGSRLSWGAKRWRGFSRAEEHIYKQLSSGKSWSQTEPYNNIFKVILSVVGVSAAGLAQVGLLRTLSCGIVFGFKWAHVCAKSLWSSFRSNCKNITKSFEVLIIPKISKNLCRIDSTKKSESNIVF